MLPLIVDDHIKRDDSGELRTYYDVKNKKHKWISVTALTKWAANKGAMFQQMIDKDPTLKDKWAKRAELGTKLHKALEYNNANNLSKYEIIYYDNFQSYLNKAVISTVAKEKAILWEGTVNDLLVGFGGTGDAIHSIDYSKLYYSDGTPVNKESTISYSVIDYKTKETNKLNSHPEYGLEYYLQCAANTAALNYRYDKAYQANKSLVLVSTSKKLYIYYLAPKNIHYYWLAFKDMLYHYYAKTPYNWTKFEEESKLYWPSRVYLEPQSDRLINKDSLFF